MFPLVFSDGKRMDMYVLLFMVILMHGSRLP